ETEVPESDAGCVSLEPSIPSRFGETLAERPITGDQVRYLGHDQAARSGPGSRPQATFSIAAPFNPDSITPTNDGRVQTNLTVPSGIELGDSQINHRGDIRHGAWRACRDHRSSGSERAGHPESARDYCSNRDHRGGIVLLRFATVSPGARCCRECN